MKGYSGLKKAGAFFVLAALLLVLGLPLTTVVSPPPVSAQVGISGSFYSQKFVIPVGSSIDVSSVYVVAFNESTEAATFIVSGSAPSAPDVTMRLTDPTTGSPLTQFVLDPSQSREVQVGVYVGTDATPGLHEIMVGQGQRRSQQEP